MRGLIAIVLVAGAASADPPKPAPSTPKPTPAPAPVPKPTAKPVAAPANLLVTVPATVAVSSTVVNNTIAPEHVADGDLATAWNSKTGELVGAWLAVRVPADAKVQSIKLTVGFTKIDKQLGDLFTMNPRIKTVRVTHAGKTVIEKALDIDSRVLQELPINGDGGDYKIEVIEIQPGTKASWKETSVSELEVWGTPGPSARPNAHLRPTVRIGSLDPPPALPDADCVKALFPQARGNRIEKGDTVVAVESIALAGTTYLCRVNHTTDEKDITAVDIAVVRGGKQTHYVALDDRFTERIYTRKADQVTEATEYSEVVVTAVPLTPTETAVQIEVSEHRDGPMLSDGTTKTTLYRVTKTGLTDVLSTQSKWSGGESDDADRCEIIIAKARPATLPDMDVHCVTSQGRWHGEDPRGNGEFTEERTEHMRWNGTTYLGR